MTPPFKRLLIANRGEIAVRIIRTCRRLGIGTVAVFSDADAGALHTRLADQALAIGPAAASQSYLDAAKIIAAAHASGAEAIHPGYGFLSENAAFARACAAAGLVFVGPPAPAIEAMGGKIAARALATSAGVPVVPGYDGPDQSVERLRAEAERIGVPLLIKASAGGGGKGMRVVRDLGEFTAALAGAQREAQAAFGDQAVFLERLIERPRHIEIQVFGDHHGNLLFLGERECSIQRRHQKVIEEAPSPFLSAERRAEMGAAAVRVAKSAGYTNAGTVEFIVAQDGSYYFLEMNTRLQVEHPVTELITGLDLVELQLAVAAGAPLPFGQDEVTLRGHAIEARVYAEDPQTYLPAAGELVRHRLPTGAGVRVDAGYAEGDTVGTHYDPMIAKLITFGLDRATAIARMQAALAEYTLIGLTSNLPLLRAISANPAFATGATHTGFLQEQPLETARPAAPLGLLCAAVLPLLASAPPPNPFSTAWRFAALEQMLRLTVDREIHTLSVARHPEGGWLVRHAEQHGHAVLLNASAEQVSLRLNQQELHVIIAGDQYAWGGDVYTIALAPPLSTEALGQTGNAQADAELTAPMPGTVVKVFVALGEQVAEGQPLLVLEAMKMEHTVVAPYAGTISQLPFSEGSGVASGARLIEITAES